MRLEVVSTMEGFRSLRSVWGGVLERSASRSIFLTWEWLFQWWLHFNKGKALYILLMKDREKVVGIAPFCITKVAMFGLPFVRKIMFLGSGKVGSDLMDIIVEKGREREAVDETVRYLEANCSLWDVVDWCDLDACSPLARYVSLHLSHLYRVYEKPEKKCPYIDLPGDFEELLKKLKPNIRNSLKYRTKRIESGSGIVFRSHGEQDPLKKDIDALFDLHDIRFRAKKAKSAFQGKLLRMFHYDVAEQFSKKGWLKLCFLERENRQIAALYAFKYRGRMYYYQSGFDPEWSKWAPGTVLMGYCMRESIKEGVREFHYLRGGEGYKERWTGTTLKMKSLVITQKGVAGSAYAGILAGKAALKSLVRSIKVALGPTAAAEPGNASNSSANTEE